MCSFASLHPSPKRDPWHVSQCITNFITLQREFHFVWNDASSFRMSCRDTRILFWSPTTECLARYTCLIFVLGHKNRKSDIEQYAVCWKTQLKKKTSSIEKFSSYSNLFYLIIYLIIFIYLFCHLLYMYAFIILIMKNIFLLIMFDCFPSLKRIHYFQIKLEGVYQMC